MTRKEYFDIIMVCIGNYILNFPNVFSDLKEEFMTRSTWVSTNHSEPDVYIKCQGTNCGGIIMFNAKEITDRKNVPTNTSTPCRHCGWHPAYPPEPWLPLKGAEF
jgi:hypothetical protein